MTGGVPTAGYLTAYGGTWKRSHWWVTNPDGSIHVPIGDEYKVTEDGFKRVESHRNREIFEAILTAWEGYRR